MSLLPQISNPPSIPAPPPTYSHVCSTPLTPLSRLITLAGQIGVDLSTRQPLPTFREQVAAALANVSHCLAHAGATTRDIVSVRQYIVDLLPMDPCRRELYKAWIGEHRPPSTLIGVQALAMDGLLYEIEVCAVANGATT